MKNRFMIAASTRELRKLQKLSCPLYVAEVKYILGGWVASDEINIS